MRPFWLDMEPWQLALALAVWTIVVGGAVWLLLHRRRASHERVRRLLLGRLRLAVQRGLPLDETVRGLGEDLARQAERPRPPGCVTLFLRVPLVWTLARRRLRRESEVCLDVAARLQEGGLEVGLSAAPGAFPAPWSDLLRQAEQQGSLPAALDELYVLERQSVGARQRVRTRLLYPILLMALLLWPLLFLLVVVRPKLEEILHAVRRDAGELLTFLLGVEGGVLFLAPLALFALWLLAGLAAPGAQGLPALLARVLPGARGLQLAASRAAAARLILAGLRAGLPLEQALQLLAHAPGVDPAAVATARERAREGSGLAAALTPLFGADRSAVAVEGVPGATALARLAAREESDLGARLDLLEAVAFPLGLALTGALVAVEYWVPLTYVHAINSAGGGDLW